MNSPKKIKVIITGGGTAGHVMPALAVIEVLKEHNCDICYIGSKKGIEVELVPALGIKFKTILAGKLRRYWSFKNLIDPFKTFIGFWQALFIILRFKPQVIFSKGGYVSLPSVIAGWITRKPVILHESDIALGLANRFSLKFAKRIAVSFPVENYPNIPAQKIVYTGTPLRKVIFRGNSDKGKTLFQLKSTLPILLISGGSQGARNINDKVLEILPQLLTKLQIIHITGSMDFQKFKSYKEEVPIELKTNYRVYPFLKDELVDAYACSDLIISRAGANSIFEIAAQEKPAILIPLAGHQEQNAQFLAKQKAVYVINNKDLTSEKLLAQINHILEKPQESQAVTKSLNQFIVIDSASVIASELIKLTK